MEQLDAVEWRMKAMAVLYRVTAAERRFTASMRVNEITVLAAADELEASTRDAGAWLGAHPCPDERLGAHLRGMLDTCSEVASTAQRAIIGHTGDTAAVMSRLNELLTVIDLRWESLDAW
jgi:serine/threonine protein phosphatase PrpC